MDLCCCCCCCCGSIFWDGEPENEESKVVLELKEGEIEEEESMEGVDEKRFGCEL